MHCQLPRANRTPSIILKAMQGTIKKKTEKYLSHQHTGELTQCHCNIDYKALEKQRPKLHISLRGQHCVCVLISGGGGAHMIHICVSAYPHLA